MRHRLLSLSVILLGTLLLVSGARAQVGVLDYSRISEDNSPVNSAVPGYFGWDCAPLGDLDGDGNPDIAVGHPAYHDANLLPVGAVWVLFLDSAGSVVDTTLLSKGVNNIPIMDDYTRFGTAVENLGDLNGDGVVDLAVGANLDNEGTGLGAVWILFLNTDGSVDSTQKLAEGIGGFVGPLTNSEHFGISLSLLGDQNADGRPELAVGASGAPGALGSVWILSLNPDGTVYAETRIAEGEGGFTGDLDPTDRFGSGVAALGDLDGNGVRDLAVGASGDDDGTADAGAVWILFLNADGSVSAHQKISATSGSFSGPLDLGNRFGDSVALLEDLGCGPQALAVGAPYDDDGGPSRGAAWVLFLNPDGTVNLERKLSQADPQFPIPLEDNGLFSRVNGLGDMNGDGVNDLAVGADYENNSVGAQYILYLSSVDCGPPGLADFGTVIPSAWADTTVLITNYGCVPTGGSASVSGTGFSILNGGGSYTINPGESHPVEIRFMPSERGFYSGLLETGGCGTTLLAGISEGPLTPCSGNRWNISDFNAANLDTTRSGNLALWCGAETNDPGLVTGPGYGNLWDETVAWAYPVSSQYDTTEVRLQFVANHDLAQGDVFRIQTYRLGGRITLQTISGNNRDGMGEFTDPTVVDLSFSVQPGDYIGVNGSPSVVLVLEVLSDSTHSDEDGLEDTDGAVQVDNIEVSFDQVQVSFADFEPGGSDGGWCSGLVPPPDAMDEKWSDLFDPADYYGLALNYVSVAMTVYNGELVVGGSFTYGGIHSLNRIGILDGLSWKPLGSGILSFGATVWAFTEHNGDLIVGGSFTSPSGASDNVALWDGSAWSDLGQGLNETVHDLVSFDGSIYAGIPQPTCEVARWTGSTWQTKAVSGMDYIRDMVVFDNQIFLAGEYQGQGVFGTWSGTDLVPFPGVAFDAPVMDMHVYDGKLYLGGYFTSPPAGGTPYVSIWDGAGWSGLDPVPAAPVTKITHYRGRVVTASDNVLVSYENGILIPFGTNPNETVYDMLEYGKGLFITGNFTSAGGKPSKNFGWWTDTYVVGVEEGPTPTLPLLSVNRPNPFQASTRFSMNLEAAGRVKLVVFDLAGRRVRTLMDRRVPAGRQEAVWDGRDDTGRRVASGIYLVKMGIASRSQVRKVTLIR